MDEADIRKYWEWCARQYWQYQRRSAWSYRWKGATLIRYVENVPADPEFAAGLMEYLLTDDSVHGGASGERAGATVYNKPAKLGDGWKATAAWYEQQTDERVSATGLKFIRVYQALQRNPEEGEGDGPYVMEDGCRYRVTFIYHWNAAELPEPPKGESGVSYRLTGVTRDDETGLWSCILERRERVEQEVAEYTSGRTIYADTLEEQHIGVRKERLGAAGKAADAGDGRVTRRKVTKNEDCTFDVANETEVEKAVAGASVTVSRGLKATVKTVEDRGMEKPLSSEGLKIGESVTNEMTPGGRWRRRKSETVAAAPDGPIGQGCAKTAFEHRESTTTMTAEDPEATCVEDAGGGVTRTAKVRRTEEGAYECDVETRTEKPVAVATVEVRRTVGATRTTTVSRSQTEAGSAEGLAVGEQVRSEMTPGGLWDVTKTKRELTDGRTYGSCTRGALTHTDVKRYTSKNVDVEDEVAAPEVVNGIVTTKEVRLTEDGATEVTQRSVQAKPMTDSVVTGSTARSETTVRYRNTASIEVPEAAINREVHAQVQTNEHAVKDGVVTVTEHVPQTITTETVNPLFKEKVTAGANVTATDEENGERGKVVSKRETPNEYGSRTLSKTVRTAIEATKSVEWTTTDDSGTYSHAIYVYRNLKDLPEIPDDKYRCSVSLSINEYGLYDMVISTTQRVVDTSGGGGQSQSSTGTEHRWLTYQKKDGRMYRRKVSANYLMRRERGGQLHTCILDGAESGFGFNSHDNGSFGIKYMNITIGAEIAVQ